MGDVEDREMQAGTQLTDYGQACVQGEFDGAVTRSAIDDDDVVD